MPTTMENLKSRIDAKKEEKRCIKYLKENGYKFYNDIFTNSKDESHRLLLTLRNKLQSVYDLQKLEKLIENF